MTFRLSGMALALCLQTAITNEIHGSTMLLLETDEKLSECQTFRWRSAAPEARVVLGVGSCLGCTDIAEQESGGMLSTTVALPTDGRDVYVTLTTVLNGVVIGRDTQIYRAPTTNNIQRSCKTKPDTTIGIYHWSGKATRSLSQGVQSVAEMGGSAVRLTLSPRSYRDYNIDSACIPDFRLGRFLQDADVRQALGNVSMRTIMLTTYDGTSYGDCEHQLFLNPRFYTADNRARLVEEYAEFAYELVRMHAASGKTFIVSNWESDNSVYCGSSSRYAVDSAFRKYCDANYALYYTENSGPAESLLGLREWFNARAEGIERGRRRAAAEGFGGVKIYAAAEINSVRHLSDAGLPGVLTDVLPFVQFDYVSYSSWESLNRPDLTQGLVADLDMIRAKAGTDAVILGEVGYSTVQFGDAAERTRAFVSSAARWGIRYAFQWALYDDASGSGFGLYDGNGVLTPVGSFLRQIGFRLVID